MVQIRPTIFMNMACSRCASTCIELVHIYHEYKNQHHHGGMLITIIYNHLSTTKNELSSSAYNIYIRIIYNTVLHLEMQQAEVEKG